MLLSSSFFQKPNQTFSMCVPPVRMCQILQPISLLSWCLYINNQNQSICYCFLVFEPGLDQTSKIVWHCQPHKPSKLSDNSMALPQNMFSRLPIPFSPIAFILIIIIFHCFHCLFVVNVICSATIFCFKVPWSLLLLSRYGINSLLTVRLENKWPWTLCSCKSYLNTYIRNQVPTARTKTLLHIHGNKVLNLPSPISGDSVRRFKRGCEFLRHAVMYFLQLMLWIYAIGLSLASISAGSL